MPTSIDRVRLKITRAKEHISDLDIKLRRFLNSNPYEVRTKRNPQTRQLIYYLSGVRETPVELSLITGDAVHNLRSALDHLAWQLVIAAGNTPRSSTAFPIYNDTTEYISKSPRQVQGMRQDAVNAIDAVKPYKGGNDTLWRLHKLNNIDKHRFIVTVGSSFQSIDLGAYMSAHVQQSFPGLDFPIVSAFLKVEDILFPLKVGDEVFIDAPDAELKENMTFRFTVSLRESGIIEGEPLLETLQGMADLVDNLVSDFAPLLR